MVVRTAGTPYAFLVTLYVAERNYPKGGEVGWSRPRPCPGVLATKTSEMNAASLGIT